MSFCGLYFFFLLMFVWPPTWTQLRCLVLVEIHCGVVGLMVVVVIIVVIPSVFWVVIRVEISVVIRVMRITEVMVMV